MFEGGNLLNMNLTPVTNIPLKPRFATSQVVWLSHRAIFANISQIFYFIFEGTVSICIFLLQLGSVCATCVCNINITCTTCAYTKNRLGHSCFKFITQKKKKIVYAST